MRINKGVSKTVSRKAVTKAIAKQEAEALSHSSHRQLAGEEVQDSIRLKAYELYLQRGCQQGYDVEDWLTAEQMVLNG